MITRVLIGTLSMAAVLISATELAFAEPAEKATGGVTTTYCSDHVAFNAQETVPDANVGKGAVSYSRPEWTCGSGADGFVYHFKVKYVRVDPENDVAWFAGQVTHTTNGQNLDRWMTFVVYDSDPDWLGGQWIPTTNQTPEQQEANALHWVVIGFPNPYSGTSPAIEGNLRVHP